jgi:hypothetical protein
MIRGKEKYSADKIEKLQQYLEAYAEKGQPIEYEILVDGFKAVRRTSDPEMFEMFERFVTADTKSVEIIFYQGSSRHSDKNLFYFDSNNAESGLSGIEINQKIHEQVEQAKKEWEHEQLVKEVKEWKDYAKELEEDVDRLEKQLEDNRSNQSPLQGMLGEFGSSLVSGIVRQNPKIIEKIPGLSGLIESGSDQSTVQESETEVSFSPKQESSDAVEALQFVQYIKSKLNESQWNQLIGVIDTLTEQPEKIEEVSKFIKG